MNSDLSSEALPRPAIPAPAAGRRCDIQLQNPCGYPEAGARRLRPWLSPLVEDLASGANSFTVRFISDREMRRLNNTFRQKDKTTDVLSFPADLTHVAAGETSEHSGDGTEAPVVDQRHLGDVVISVPTARRQASRLGHSVAVELQVLLLHGVLHCLGHDHETDGGVMERLEQRLRRRYIPKGRVDG